MRGGCARRRAAAKVLGVAGFSAELPQMCFKTVFLFKIHCELLQLDLAVAMPPFWGAVGKKDHRIIDTSNQ
jgi:hypothetical protein